MLLDHILPLFKHDLIIESENFLVHSRNPEEDIIPQRRSHQHLPIVGTLSIGQRLVIDTCDESFLQKVDELLDKSQL